ncbi:MAG: hypothetical protein AAF226_02695, partial [Verrucomicrobiota bacterium]
AGTVTDLAAQGPEAVEALDGSVRNDLVGDIRVESYGATGVTVTGGVTPLIGTGGSLHTADRNRRFASIGHGGSSSTVDNASGSEDVSLRILDSESGSEEFVTSGTVVNRGLTFMNLIGDVDVHAHNAGVLVQSGTNTFDYAKIGHGGNDLADYETSNAVIGDISVSGATDLTVTGNQIVTTAGHGNSTATWNSRRNQAQVGHGGYRSGLQYFTGDITIDFGGDVEVQGGREGASYSKIGHQGFDSWGQAGGEFFREESFYYDRQTTGIEAQVSGSTFTLNYATDPLSTNFVGSSPVSYAISGNTADITVLAGGDVKLSHLDSTSATSATETTDARYTGGAFSHIGHGGQNIDALRNNGLNQSYNYADKVGDITVTSGGAVILEGGNDDTHWSAIGHRGSDESDSMTGVGEMVLGGTINVSAGVDILLDGNAGAESDADTLATELNGTVIGHGSMMNTDAGGNISVLDDGATINGLTGVQSDINVVAQRDVLLQGGNGYRGSHSQVGHGFATATGQGTSLRGFDGDISVYAGRDIDVLATQNAVIIENISGSTDDLDMVDNAAAFIGNGGIQLDAVASGDIEVFAGNNLTIQAQQRTEETEDLFVGPYGNFAKIGHTSNENGMVNAGGNNDQINGANMSGDITVVVSNDMIMTGGRSIEHQGDDIGQFLGGGNGLPGTAPNQSVFGAFAQVGHGGPGVNGDLDGDITVLVENDLTTNDGTINLQFTGVNPIDGEEGNNYVKIGHGDWLRDGVTASDGAIFSGSGVGTRSGDIVVAVGNNATLEHTLIGHEDPAGDTVNNVTSGNTHIAVSRNHPFDGGTGVLTATMSQQASADGIGNLGSVFTSGELGTGSELRFYMPARANNALNTDGTSRLNSDATLYASGTPTTLAAYPYGSGPLAGEADEVFLTPDLWWMSGAEITDALAEGFTATGVFPGNAASGQGGINTIVTDPGDLPNLATLFNGALGSSPNAGIYRGGHGLNGSQYTLYYDALFPVPDIPDVPTTPIVPAVAPIPLIPFTFTPFTEQFDSFIRASDGQDGIFGYPYGGEEPYLEGEYEDTNAPGWFIEEWLDESLGSRQDRSLVAEDDEERRRRQEREDRPVNSIGITYYVYNPDTNQYSSYRMFGVPR